VDIVGARASLRGDLRHHAWAASETGAGASLRQWAEEAHAAFVALERDGADLQAMASLDGLRARLNEDLRVNGANLAYSLGDAARIRAELADVTRQRNVMAERAQQLQDDVRLRRRRHIVDLASSRRYWVKGHAPKHLSPWRSFKSQKRERIRRLREDYIAILNSPLFDAAYYRATYPDIGGPDVDPILHYLTHGSSEGRWPSAAVDPVECMSFFPELAKSEGNFVLRLIALQGARTDGS
jgi:hypothetical protein